MNARIISIGSELVLGQSLDTNSAWLAQRLVGLGIPVSRHVTVADNLPDIVEAILDAARQVDIVLITGGLGPTPDDLTRDALAAAMGVELELRPECLEQIAAFFRSRNRPMHEANRVQAMIPHGATPLDNTRGTAPGIRARVDRADVFVMPGVPAEMETMFERSVLPALSAKPGREMIVQRTLRSFGMAEAKIGEKIADLMARGRNPSVGTSASDLIIAIRVTARAPSEAQAKALADGDAAEIHARLGDCIFAEGDEEMQSVVGRMLIEKKLTVSTAESCTGGLIAKRLTDVPGSSAYFIQSFVTYSNEAKTRLLGIPPDLIAARGAVSEEVARAMAQACRKISGTDCSIAVTGIAGPTGGTAEKPVGLVYVALSGPAGVTVKELRLGDTLTRREVRDRSAKAALNMLRMELMKR